jgi:DNA-binding MurR/RpiR family transcriptional regulator
MSSKRKAGSVGDSKKTNKKSDVIDGSQASLSSPEPSKLEARVSSAYASLSRRRQKFMQVILENPDETFFLSLRQLAKKLNVDPATVSRMIKVLGYNNFSEFGEELREHFVEKSTPYTVTRYEESVPRTLEDRIIHSVEKDLHNLSNLRSSLDFSAIEKAVESICNARHVIVGGLDLANVLAKTFAYNLSIIGIMAEAPVEDALLKYKVHNMTKDDLLIGISFRRCNRPVVEAILEAGRKNVPTLSITDTVQSPLARFADNTLLSSISSPSFGASLVAPNSIINALLVGCIHQSMPHSMEVLEELQRDYYDTGDRWYKAEPTIAGTDKVP